MRRLPVSTLLRPAIAAATIGVAAFVAAGCGGSGDGDGGGTGESGLVGDAGPLAWLPQDTWLVATANLDPKAIDDAVTSLDRLPIWALAEGFLPASDGKGLRRELLEEVAKATADGADDTPRVTAKELEAAFGNRGGIAITSNDFESFEDGDGADAPLVMWIEVDDEDAALGAARDLFDGSETEEEHEGTSYFRAKDADATFLVRDDLLVVSTSPGRIEELIDLREGDAEDTLAGDATAAAVIEASVGDALLGAAIASEPILEAAPELAKTSAKRTTDEGASLEQQEQAAKATRLADDLGPLLESDAIDDLVPNWMGGSITIDTTGLRMRGAWSNPRDLADPDTGSRELVERMPADVPVVNATVTDGSGLGRVQDAWAEVRDAYDLDLRELVADECAPADQWSCTLGLEVALTLLEDERLATTMEDMGDTSMVTTQDLSPLLGSLAQLSDPAAGRGGAAAPAPAPVKTRLYELVTTAATPAPDWVPSTELVAAATAAGLIVQTNEDRTQITLRVRPGSPMARELTASATPESTRAAAAMGVDLRALLSPAGLRFEADEVDGLQVWGFPPEAESKVVPALEGDADTLGELDTYREVVEAADVPDEVGVYGFVNLRSYVEAIINTLGSADPQVQRVLPTVRNNLADVPGVVTWTTREEVEGETVGVAEVAMPILD